MLYKVSIPTITHEAIINYLKKYNLIQEWKKRPTFKTLLDKEKTKIDTVYSAFEVQYNYKGNEKGAGKKVFFSLHEYGKFMYPHIAVILRNKLSLPKQIILPDLFFKYYYGKAINEERQLIVDPEDKEVIILARKYKDVLEKMIYSNHKFSVHIRIEDALYVNDWWYLKCILTYNSMVFENPYTNRAKSIFKADKIYPYHLFSHFLSSLDEGIVKRRFLRLKKRILEFTPKDGRKDFFKLTQAKRDKIEAIYNNNVKMEEMGDDSTDDEEDRIDDEEANILQYK